MRGNCTKLFLFSLQICRAGIFIKSSNHLRTSLLSTRLVKPAIAVQLTRPLTSSPRVMTNWEAAKASYLSLSQEDRRRNYKCGNNFKTLNDVPTWDAYAKIKALGGSGKNAKFSANPEINSKISIFTGDITTLEIDAIVNAANDRLAGGGGVDGAIHNAADRDLLRAECGSLKGCPTGDSKITGGYKLPAKYIIHTVGPVGEKSQYLESCYKRSLEVLNEMGLRSIAFPCISTGVYGYPNEAAAEVALSTVRQWLDENVSSIDRVIFCLFLDVDIKIYEKLLPEYFPN